MKVSSLALNQSGVMRSFCAAAFSLSCLTTVSESPAWVLSEDPFEETSTELGIIGRSYAFLSAGTVLKPPFAPEGSNPAAQSLFDARFYASHKTADYRFVVHNQSSMDLSSVPTSGALNLGRGVPPPRLFPLTFVYEQDTLRLQNSTDWLYGEVRLGELTFTVGRQPISFGRGSLFRTNDLVSTFSLTEVDRMFKPGADALRVDWSFSGQQNIVILGSFGDYTDDLSVSADGSTGVLQYKKGGSWGEFSLMGAYVRGDAVFSVDGVTSELGFDLYGEVTTTLTTDLSLATPGVEGDVYVKAMLGSTFRPVDRFSMTTELFYGGNGAKNTSDYLSLIASKRFQIGDQTSVGRYYASLSNLWEVTPLSSLSWGMMANLSDPSALLFSFLQQSLSADTSAQLGFYAPIGRLPQATSGAIPLSMESEFGTYPYFFFAQLTATL